VLLFLKVFVSVTFVITGGGAKVAKCAAQIAKLRSQSAWNSLNLAKSQERKILSSYIWKDFGGNRGPVREVCFPTSFIQMADPVPSK